MVPSSPTHAIYAAADPGFPALPVSELLAEHADLIARLKLCYGTDGDSFEREVMSLVRRYAAYVHLLPATADNYFGTPGGLLRLGMEVAFFSLQGTDAHIFSGRSTISARRHLEPRWRLATFIAGLCSECHRVLTHLIITDAAGEPWSGYLSPLADWLVARQTDRYFIRWRPQATESRGLGIFALPHIVPADVLLHLSDDNTVIVPQLMASIGGVALYRDHNVLDELVRRSLALVIDRNLIANADRYGMPQFGSHLERYLVDALRRLAANNSSWIPNRDKSRVWFGSDGLFLLWPAAADDVRQLLEGDQLRGIPKAPETMLEVLLAAGVFTARDAGRPTWTIRQPGAKVLFGAVRLTSPTILFAGVEPCPSIGAALAVDVEVTPSAPPPAPPPAPEPAVAAPGAQLSLIPSEPDRPSEAAPREPAPADAIGARVTPPSPTLSLRAPMRLNPAVRDALDGIVRTLNDGLGPAQCCTIAEGLFVPLDRFEQRGVPSAVALRALSDASLLVIEGKGTKGPPTRSRDLHGAPTTGLVIDPRFIDGFDLDGFILSTPHGA